MSLYSIISEGIPATPDQFETNAQGAHFIFENRDSATRFETFLKKYNISYSKSTAQLPYDEPTGEHHYDLGRNMGEKTRLSYKQGDDIIVSLDSMQQLLDVAKTRIETSLKERYEAANQELAALKQKHPPAVESNSQGARIA